MSAAEQPAACPNCGRSVEGEKHDAAGWCEECRSEVVRRANLQAWITVGVLALPVLVAFARTGLLTSRLVVVWLVIAGGFLFLIFKVARRVAFEATRARGVPPHPHGR